MIAKEYLVPYVRPFPVWLKVDATDFLTGYSLGHKAWKPHGFGVKRFRTAAEARAAMER
jgi:hypothetical protein